MLTYSLKPVKGKKKIDLIFKLAFKFYEHDAVIFVCYDDIPVDVNLILQESKTIEYIVAVRKKDARKAVIRNRIKRLLRESLRHEFKIYQDNGIVTPIKSLAVVWGNIPAHPGLISLNDVQPVISKLMSRATEDYQRILEKN